jgi:hypothetical protein
MIYLGKPYAALTSFEVADQEKEDDDFLTLNRSIGKRLQSYQFPNKAKIKYEFDNVSETVKKSLWAMLRNRSTLCEGLITIPEPWAEYASLCLLDYLGITGPYAPPYTVMTHYITWADQASAPTLPWGTQLATADYTKVGAYDANDWTQAYTTQGWLVLGFKFSNFISQFGLSDLHRFTLYFWGMQCSPIRVWFWDNTSMGWYLMRNVRYYDDTDFALPGFYKYYMFSAAMGLPWGYASLSDFVDIGNSRVYFLLEFPAGAGNLYMQYARLGINAYHVGRVNNAPLNFRDPYIGAGYRGTLHLEEI